MIRQPLASSRLAFVLVLFAISVSLAQDAAPEASAEQPQSTQTQDEKSLGQLVFDGKGFGIIFYVVLIVFSIAAFTVGLERLVNLTRGNVMPPAFVNRLRQLLESGQDNAENLKELCGNAKAPIAAILSAGVLRAGRPWPEVEKGMEDAAAREMISMRGRNRILKVVGAVAPLVGLLGTVVGMIFAFRVSSQAGLGKAELLAEGIYLALMTTAAGLAIAIPCLLLTEFFNARVEKFMLEIDRVLLETMPSFQRLENSTADER